MYIYIFFLSIDGYFWTQISENCILLLSFYVWWFEEFKQNSF